MSRARLLLHALCAVLFAPLLHAATFTVSGTTLQLDLAANETCAITAGATNYTFALTGGTWSGADSAEATGNGTTSLSAVKASFTAVTVDDSGTGVNVIFNDSGANTYTSNFTVTLDSTAPGVSDFNGTTAFSGSAALFVQSGRIFTSASAIVSVVNGNLTLHGNLQNPARTGSQDGVTLNGTQVKSTGTGNVSIKGFSGTVGPTFGIRIQGASVITGGTAGSTLTLEGDAASGLASNSGGIAFVATNTVTTLGGDVVIKGTGGQNASNFNVGVYVEMSTSISATGNGSIHVTGTGGGVNSNDNYGIVLPSGGGIFTENGNLTVTATGGGGSTGSSNYGVNLQGSIRSTGSGNVSVTGTGGPGSGSNNSGVLMVRQSGVQEIRSGTGNVTVTGTAGGGSTSYGIFANSVSAAPATISTGAPGGISLIADSISLVTSAVISAPTVSITPKTAGKNMDLGSTSDTIANTLALSQAELNTITAATLNLGDVNTSAINLSANLTRPAGSITHLTAATINFNSFTFTGGTLYQTSAGQPDISLSPPAGAFGSIAQGSARDVVFTLSNLGFTDLTGISLSGLSGTDFSVTTSPAASVVAGGSTTFTLRFAPTGFGIKSATLQIASNDPDENPALIVLSGFGASALPISGTKSVGPTGFYTSLTLAIADIQSAGIGGPTVLELQPSYVSSVETFPLTFSNLGTTATNTLTIQPQLGATGLSISSADTTAATVDLNGAQFVTIDGRPGGTGTAKELTIENTSTSGVAVRFINEASNNTLKFVTMRGVNTSATSGTVLFSTTTGANGNDNNTIDTCDIRDGASTPNNGISSLGTTATVAQNNSGNTVSDSNIFNFYTSAATDSVGLRLDSGNTDWTITGNSFYQTASRTGVNATNNPARAIFINNTSGNNFTVSGNFIGGSEPNAGGTAWTAGGTGVAYRMNAIQLNVGTTTPSRVQGNTIANIVWTTNSNINTPGGGPLTGIYVTAGDVNIGTVTGNTIGSGTGTGSISVTTSGNGGTTFGIGSASSGTVNISNNTIGSITTNGTATTIAASLVGISVTGGVNTISNNTVGSTTTANSLNAANSSTAVQQVTGIISTSTGSASITGNTVANLYNNYANTNPAGQIRGIITTAGVNTITGNSVRNLSTTSRNQNTLMTATTGHSVVGIAAISTTDGQTVSQNIVHSLANTAASAAIYVTGIYYNGPTTGTNLIAGNFVHSLAISSTSTGAVLNGMQFASGRFTAQNNMVRVGLKSDGTSTASASIVRGIYDDGTTQGRNFYHNSVYVGGTQTSGAANTFAFGNNIGNGLPPTRAYRNNIYVNARSNSGGTGKHYAANYAGNNQFNGGLTANNNLFFVSGTGGVLGLYDGVDRTTLAAWQTALGGREANSLNADPLFVLPTGTAATVDLHLQTTSPAIGAAVVLAAVTNDFDGQARDATPDIGADEFFTPFQVWAAANSQSNDPEALGPNGQANLLNFAFGMAPTASGALVLNGTLAAGGIIGQTGTAIAAFEPSGNGVDFRALFVRRKDYVTAGLTYTPQFSADMTTWFNSATVPTVLADDGTHQIVSVPYPPFVGGGKKARFFRINVSL